MTSNYTTDLESTFPLVNSTPNIIPTGKIAVTALLRTVFQMLMMSSKFSTAATIQKPRLSLKMLASQAGTSASILAQDGKENGTSLLSMKFFEHASYMKNMDYD